MQALILIALAGLVVSHVGVAPEQWSASGWLIWVVVAIAAMALVLNTITRSKRERMIWAPVTALMLLSSLVVALAG